MVQFFYANCFIVTPQNTCRYAQYVERCCAFHDCVKNCTQTTQNHADALRNFAPLREKHMLFCQESLHTHRLTQNLLRIFLRHKDIRTYFIFTQNSRTYTEFAPPFFRHKNTRAYFIFRQNSRKYTEFAPHASAKVCAVCVRQFHPAWFTTTYYFLTTH